ncbi:Cop1-interacting protein [Thalictrum thalictroides]|uniref:Cop1-interacting protein n=1 Tax=Thalictrum thalictroides TaxID=46969 RepID=A0A7J6WJQ8_THATH|nr:Cop1-interacting protein [Thalictrum thalictroides]
MKSKTRLDSAIFQLTPTRTRCDLVIVANGASEKIASGLLNPFLAHLKTAQDQIAKGGYSITLEPRPDSETAWFTKGTMERFVRFVSTPEVLERVNTIESEILQIEESIAIQSSENMGLSTQEEFHQNRVEDRQTRMLESIEGTKPVHDTDTEKAIVLYKPEADVPDSNGSTRQEENSRVQLLKVLETRKAVLQKEQGMAFARAVAAGFEMDHILNLISFGESFGATRLMEACLRFVQLWKEKHETGQWVEIDVAETISNRSDLSSLIVPESNVQLSNESSGKTSNDSSADKRPPLDAQVPPGNQEYYQGEYQHPMFPQWPNHSPPGAPPIYHPYPMHAMPYYQNYPGSGPYFQPPCPPMEDPRFNSSQRLGKRQSMESRDSYNTESESGELGVSNMRSQDGSELENEGSRGREPRRKAGRSSKKQAGKIVIRNINYITSKKKSMSGSESESASDPETDNDSEDLGFDSQEIKRKHSRSSQIGVQNPSSSNISNSYGKVDGINGQETDDGNWEAFQKFLLRNDDKDAHNTEHDMFSMEKEGQVTRRKNTAGSDPIVSHGQQSSDFHNGRMIDLDLNSSKGTRMLRSSSDDLVRDFGGKYNESQKNIQLTELEGGRGGYKRVSNDEFMIHRRESQLGLIKSDTFVGNELEGSYDNWERRSSHTVVDESFVVPLRSGVQDQIGTDSRTTLDMDVEFPSSLQTVEESSSKVKSQVSYEPDDLSLIPERGRERYSNGYDPAMDYEMQLQADDSSRVVNGNQDDAVSDVKEEGKKLFKDKKFKGQNSLEKRKIEAAATKGKPSKFSPSTDAQARAAKLRAYKADLQKMKKEKEEEELKRLEALKRERQKRIAGRANPSPAQPQVASQTKPRLTTKLSPNLHRGSKFSDSEPGSSSPIQRLPTRTTSVGSNESQKVTKPSRLSNSGRIAVNGLSRSVSSLPELKEKDATTPEPKVSTARIRRLSEPKTSTIHHTSSVKLRSTNPVSNSKVSDGPEIKKISAIMSLDRTKAATLPELKIRTQKETSDMIHNKAAAKEATQKSNGIGSSVTSESSKVKRSNEFTSRGSNGDENAIIEKSVVTLEPEVPSIPSLQRSEEMTEIRKASYKEQREGTVVSEYAAIHAPVSRQSMVEIAQDPSECLFNNQPNFHEAKADHAGTLPYISSISVTEKPYHAPYARASSLEDSGSTKLEYNNAPNKNMAAVITGTANTQVSDLEESPESLGKPQGKETSKGFKRLLKFGRKNSSAGERSVESDKLSTSGFLGDDNCANSVPDEVHTLKNLLSQDETPTASSINKTSRHFSLLSPFRTKTSEKKMTV